MSARAKTTLLALATLLLCLAAAEGVLRALGREPWTPLFRDLQQPVAYQPDPVLGWRHKPGEFVFGPFSPRGRPITMRFLADASRATGAAEGPGRGSVVVVGGSFTEGFAVQDHETFAWKLQQEFPEFRFRNHGTGGYGTYQSLLVLEELFARGERPLLVLYGFFDGHDIRNVASRNWIRLMALTSRRQGRAVAVPYATLDRSGALVRHPPEAHPLWPLRQRSALVTLLQDAWGQLRVGRRAASRQAVTEQLLLEMHRLCERHGAELLVAILFAGPHSLERYGMVLGHHGVAFVNCASPLTPDLIVPGDGHPNAVLHGRWAACIAPALRRRLARLAPARAEADATARPASSRP